MVGRRNKPSRVANGVNFDHPSLKHGDILAAALLPTTWPTRVRCRHGIVFSFASSLATIWLNLLDKPIFSYNLAMERVHLYL